MFDRLRDHQLQAQDVMSRATATLLVRQPDAMRVAQIRWELARVLRAYQIYKHVSVFDPIIRADDRPDRVALARRLKADCTRQGELFQSHLLRWSGEDVVARWADYAPATIALLDGLRAHIDRERRAIAQLEAIGAPAAVATAPAIAADPRNPPPTMRF